MQYNPPTGGAANDPYVGKNTAAGIQGSKVPPAAVEFPQREIMSVIAAAIAAGLLITPTNSDVTQLLKSIEYLIPRFAPAAPGAASKGGLAKDGSGNFLLSLGNLDPDGAAISGADILALQRASDGALQSGTIAEIAAFILAQIPNPDNTLWHEGALAGSGAAFTTTLTPSPKVDASGINMRVTVGTSSNSASATLDFGFGPKPLVINSTAQAVVGGEFIPNEAHTVDIFYDGTRCRLMNVSAPPVTLANNSAPFSFPASQGLGNNVSTTISLAGFATPWGSGNASGFTFSKAGIYTIDFELIVQVTTTRNDQTGDATQARFYTTAIIYKNGNSIKNNAGFGSSNQSIGSFTTDCSYTSVFKAGDVISIVCKGTGDSFTSGGASLIPPSSMNITLVR